MAKRPLIPVDPKRVAVGTTPGSIEILDPTSDQRWNDILTSLGGGSLFHTAAWARVLTGTYGYRPCYFVVFQSSTALAAIPLMEINSRLTGRRGVGLPFSDFCDPLFRSPEALNRAVAAAVEYGRCQHWRYLELRGTSSLGASAPGGARYYGHTLHLEPDFTKIFSRFDSSVRRAIRKAQRAGVTAEISSSVQAVSEYYRLHCLTRRRHGLPPQPFRFFERLHEQVIEPGHGFVLTARWEGAPIAAAVFGHARASAIYKFGASHPGFQHLRGSNLVMSRAIEWCSGHGIKSLDLGRTDQTNEGLRRFKRGWGAEETEIRYSRYGLAKSAAAAPGSETREPGLAICRYLPISLLRVAGELIYSHLG